MVNPFSGSGIMQTLPLSRWELCFMGHYSKCVICSVLLCGYQLIMVMQISFYFFNQLCAGSRASCSRTGSRSEYLQCLLFLTVLGAGRAAHSLLHVVGQGLGAFVVCSNVTCFPISLMNGLCWRISDVQRMPVSAICEMMGQRGQILGM